LSSVDDATLPSEVIDASVKKVFAPLENKSATKLSNSNIRNLRNETIELPRTRGTASKLFKSKPLGNSLISINLLADAIQIAAICSKCKLDSDRKHV